MVKNIILTGFMGTGKTTVGKILAQRLGYRFVDTDDLIVTQQRRSISDIFEQLGEPAFRQMEADAAQALAQERGLVVATGGRLMLDPANAAALGGTGKVFCLLASSKVILARLQVDENKRPLLAGADPYARIVALLAERKDGYGRFVGVDSAGKKPAQIVDEIISHEQIRS